MIFFQHVNRFSCVRVRVRVRDFQYQFLTLSDLWTLEIEMEGRAMVESIRDTIILRRDGYWVDLHFCQ